MRGITAVVSFAFLGTAALALGSWAAAHPAWTPGDKQGFLSLRPPTSPDITFAVQLFGVGLVALIAIALVGNGLLRLSRSRS